MAMVSIDGLGQDMNGPRVLTSNATIVGHARPSFSDLTEQDSLVLDYEIDSGDPPLVVSIPLYNFDHSALQARFSVESVTGLGSDLSLDSVPSGLIGSTPDTVDFSFDPAGLPAGSHAFQIEIEVMDEDLPGAASGLLSIDLTIQLNEDGGEPADFNNDGVVDGVDLTTLLGSWGTSNNDITGDGLVSGPDLARLLAAWGPVKG